MIQPVRLTSNTVDDGRCIPPPRCHRGPREIPGRSESWRFPAGPSRFKISNSMCEELGLE